jgi:putative phosphoesterase
MGVAMTTARERFLPPDIPADRLAACLGLVSDTHLPDRCAALPPALFAALDGVDLLLHAGDVGELRVLDQLSALAPTVAVHGNDETEEAQRALPYQQLVAVAGRRILLTHAHYPDRAEELASRKDDAWGPKLARRADLGRRAGAAVVVFGHTHIPMTYQDDELLLVNPGAIASGNGRSRQLRRSVALLYLRDDGHAVAVHVDLAAPERVYEPRVEWDAGFRAALDRVSASILSPELEAEIDRLVARVGALPPEQARPAWQAWNRAAHRCWSGEQAVLTPGDVLAEVRRDTGLSPAVRAEFEAILGRHAG